MWLLTTLKLILFIIVITTTTSSSLLLVLPLHPASMTITIRGRQREINALLGVQPHHKGRDVHHLFPHTNVSLPDEKAGRMDRFGKAQLVQNKQFISLKPRCEC